MSINFFGIVETIVATKIMYNQEKLRMLVKNESFMVFELTFNTFLNNWLRFGLEDNSHSQSDINTRENRTDSIYKEMWVFC